MNELTLTNAPATATNPALTHQPTVVSHASLADLPRDIALAAEDRDIAAAFSTAMQGAPREFVHRALRWYSTHIAQTNRSMDFIDRADARDARNAMRAEWGSTYEQNMDAIRATFRSLPPAVQQAIENARLDDGTALFNSVAGLRWLFDLARTPTGSGVSASSITSELEELQKLMGQRGSRYWKGPEAPRLQARYRHLIEQRMGAR